MAEKTPTKAELRAELEALYAKEGKPVPEGLTNVQQHFDALEALTGKPDPRRPPKVAGGGAVRASEPPVAPAAPAAPAEALTSDPPAPAELEAAKADDEAAKGDDETAAPAAPEPAPERAKVSPSGRWIVAEGLTVTCAAGKVGAFQEIRAIDVGGQEALDELIELGTVVPAKR